ncbi:MAG TPA: efflux RND transporter permease subunit, partial [Candidatus Omnitrophota bacterium]|nr:efflux RND transporter permease subunit [Candidatus Omnitrophota bacterium]
MSVHKSGVISGIVDYFARAKITSLIIGFSFLIGLFAVFNIPREEEPQISVPMFDIFVSYPGATAEEVERRIVTLGERKLWEIPGVEYIYSTSETNGALIIVRFKVGEDVEKSLIKLCAKVNTNLDFLPKGASVPLIKQRSIDDVPILALTFYGKNVSPVEMRRVVAGIQTEVNAVPDVSETHIIGGRARQFQIFIDEKKLKERMLSPVEIIDLVRRTNVKLDAGHLQSLPGYVKVEADAFFRTKEDLENLVIGVSQGGVVFLKDVAKVVDGADESENAVNIRFVAREAAGGAVQDAVT